MRMTSPAVLIATTSVFCLLILSPFAAQNESLEETMGCSRAGVQALSTKLSAYNAAYITTGASLIQLLGLVYSAR